MERRVSPRVKCRLRCELTRHGKRTQGTILDFSDGGLCVETEIGVEQGTALTILMQSPRGGQIALDALVWHVRQMRHRASGVGCHVLGLMISKAPDEYFGLLPTAESDSPRDRPEGNTPVVSREEPAPSLSSFRIRVKTRSGPRTRVLSMSALSVDEARGLATSDLGSDWEILEVYEA